MENNNKAVRDALASILKRFDKVEGLWDRCKTAAASEVRTCLYQLKEEYRCLKEYLRTESRAMSWRDTPTSGPIAAFYVPAVQDASAHLVFEVNRVTRNNLGEMYSSLYDARGDIQFLLRGLKE